MLSWSVPSGLARGLCRQAELPYQMLTCFRHHIMHILRAACTRVRQVWLMAVQRKAVILPQRKNPHNMCAVAELLLLLSVPAGNCCKASRGRWGCQLSCTAAEGLKAMEDGAVQQQAGLHMTAGGVES